MPPVDIILGELFIRKACPTVWIGLGLFLFFAQKLGNTVGDLK